MPKSIECYFRLSLHKEYRDDFYFFNVCDFSEIIDKVVAIHQVNIAKLFKATWIIMIAVDNEDWNFHTQVLICIVCLRKLVGFKLDLLLT